MAEYENVFNEMVSTVYDENAIANLQNQINEGFDEVTCEDYLELIREGITLLAQSVVKKLFSTLIMKMKWATQFEKK